jgi:hypothetical protein
MILREIGPIDDRTRPAILYREVAAAVALNPGRRDQLSRGEIEMVNPDFSQEVGASGL